MDSVISETIKPVQVKASISWLVTYGGKSGDYREKGDTIIFEADSYEQAWADAMAWGNNRIRAWNEVWNVYEEDPSVFDGMSLEEEEYYHRVSCVKLYFNKAQRVDEKGYLPPSSGMCLAEWKMDFPGEYEQWAPKK